ncbi:hypothetical protein [Hymenobacter properus]|uniref:Uncharacterized protein n=1 Tax=Hymenobacter properus TaxID=2791026 RepID=A0A931FLG6_9BACT|nr:hypothetical protein [Hymenobacter properus]MBF9144178.1 hypothetical protein [Hymenobacter properus]MBR7722995.1 hypothetical protein [Microvirga sp. SRT04]
MDKRNFLLFESGYTAGRFAHSTLDYRPKIDLLGGTSPPRIGQPVEHRFDGVLFGAAFEQEYHRTDLNRTTRVLAGLDLLAASDRLTIGDGRRANLALGALHPHLAFGLTTKNWQLSGGGGVLVGRVGYYGATRSGYVTSSTVVDTVTAVPTFQIRVGWRNWVLVENGYGTNGLFGLANPAWQTGIGTGFGPHSPVAILVGVTTPESADFKREESDFGYLRVETSPAASRWRASGFITFGSASYGRLGVQASYRLPLQATGPASRL